MTDFDHDALTKSKGSSAAAACGWNFIVLMSRQGKIRLSEFFSSYTDSQKKRILRDIAADVLPRQAKMCNIIEKGEYKFVYRRYASLYFIVGAPVEMNELIVLEQIHLFVEALDGYFNSGEFIHIIFYMIYGESLRILCVDCLDASTICISGCALNAMPLCAFPFRAALILLYI